MNNNQDNCSKSITDDEEMVRLLLLKETDVHKFNEDGLSSLTNAVKHKKLNILEIFIEHGVKLGDYYQIGNLLHYFITSETQTYGKTHEAVFNLLVNQGCDVNAKNHKGLTPLHLAIKYGNYEVAKRLIKRGANVNCRDSFYGFTPLHTEIWENETGLLELLVKNGADVNAKTYKGQTALHLDCNGDATKKLIELGAHVDVRDNDGMLPLENAIQQQNHGAVWELLKFGADINDTDFRRYENNVAVISRHLLTIREAEMPINKQLKPYPIYFTVHCSRRSMPICRSDGCTEYDRLKDYKITDTISLYDFLHMNRPLKCVYVKNEKLKKLVSNPAMVEKQFPVCFVLILGTYHNAVARRKMLKTAKVALYKLVNGRLPELCLHEICGYLNNVNLRSTIEAAKDIKITKKV